MELDTKKLQQLRKEAANRAISNEIKRIADEHLAIVTAAIREDNRRTGAAIDSSFKRAKIQNERVTTRQVEFDRKTLYDYAETNPTLARAIRRLQGRQL